MSKGSNTQHTESRSSTAPDPTAYAAYQDLVSRATRVSNKPYEAYTGEETAGINDQQRAGFQNINSGVAGFDPNEAWSDIGQGSSAVNADDIAKYNDPYTNQVVNATQADFDVQNQRADTITRGNAASANALGGNRAGVAQALTQEAQNRVQAPQIAALRSAGFQSAEQMANQQKARQLQGGQTAEQLGMAGANAQVGVGTMEQQTQQAADTQRMQDYYRAQGYDFQTAQWLASVVLPTGSQMGSTSTGSETKEGPKPNQFAQIAGLGLAAGAMFIPGGQAAAPGIAAAALRAADGGRIRGFATGGSPWDGGAGWVPDVKVTGSKLEAAPLPRTSDPSKPKDDSAKLGTSLGTLGKGLYDEYYAPTQQGKNGLETDRPDNNTGIYTGPANEPGFANTPDWSGSTGYWARGGAVRRGFAEGGAPDFAGGVEQTPYDEYTTWLGPQMKKAYAGDADAFATLEAAQKNQPPSNTLPAPVLNSWEGMSPEARRKMNSVYNGRRERGGPVRGFAEGGVPISTGFGGGFDDDELSPNDIVRGDRFQNPLLGSDQYKDIAGHSAALKAEGALRSQPEIADAGSLTSPRPVKTTSFLPPAAGGDGGIVKRGVDWYKTIKPGAPVVPLGSSGGAPRRALGFADAPDDSEESNPSGNTDISSRGRTSPRGVAAAPDSGASGFGISDEARQGLIAMGLNMMANQRGGKGSTLGSIGEGGTAGMTTYASAKAATAAQDTLRRKEAFEREKFDRPYREMTADQQAKHNDGRYAIVPGVTTADGAPIERDTRHPNSPPINAITRKPLTPEEMSTVQSGGWKPFGDKVTADESADPVLINHQGQVKNARTGQLLGADAKLQSAKEVVLSGSNVDTRAYQLALGDTKGAYAGLPFGSGGNRPKALVREQAVSKLMNEGGMSEREAAEYLSAQSQAYTASGTGLSAEARTAGVREANLKIILKATDAAIPAALEASQAVARTGWVPLNKIIEKGRVVASNPELKEFGMANLQLAEHWARAMNPTGVMRESDRDMALHFLSTTDSAQTYARAVAQLKKQIDRELGAVQSVKSHGGFGAKVSEKDSTADTARKELTTGSVASAPPPPPAAAQKTIARTGKINSGPNAGKTVTEYSDGTREIK